VCYILGKDPKQARVLPPVTYHLLYLATLAGDAEILAMLFENGADLSQPRNLENKPISLAIKSRHVDCLRLLLQHNLAKSKMDTREYSTLMLAIANNEKDAVPMLLESGEDPAFVTAEHESALFLACFFGKEWLNVIKMICERTTKLDLDYSVVGAKTAIHWACGSKCPEIVELLLENGVDASRLDPNGRTGLFYLLDAAPEPDIIRILEMMVAHRLDIASHQSIVVDFITAIRRPASVIEWLFQHGVDPLAQYGNRAIADWVKGYYSSPPMRKIYDTYCQKQSR
jgi:ankyrin repeat protein